MKKVIVSCLLCSTLALVSLSPVHAEDVNDKIETTKAEKEETKKNDALFSIETKDITVGETREIKMNKYQDVTLEGKFEAVKSDAYDLTEDGRLTVKKAGKLKVEPVFKLTEDSYKALKEVIDKEKTKSVNLLNKNIKLDPINLEIKERKQETIKVSSGYVLSPETLTMGKSGKISRESYKGILMEGQFVPKKTDVVELKADGTLTPLKEGKETVEVTYNLSEKTIEAIKKNYLDENKDKGLTMEDLVVVDDSKTANVSIEVKKAPVKEKVEVRYSVGFNLDNTQIKMGSSAKLSVQQVNGVDLKGEYSSVSNAFVSIDKTGKVTPKKVGSTTITPKFVVSEQSKKELKESYIKSSNKPELTVDDIKLVEEKQTQAFDIKVLEKDVPKKEKLQIDVTTHFKASSQNLRIGAPGGKVTVDPIHGVAVKGSFKAIKNPVIDFKEDGSFIGLQAGSVELVPHFELSKESLDAIAEVVLKEKGNEAFTRSDVEFIQKDIAQMIPITFTSAANNNNNSGGSGNNKQYVPATQRKTLPQTDEASTTLVALFGLLLMVGSGIFFKKARQRS